jgi:hypothetical protein
MSDMDSTALTSVDSPADFGKGQQAQFRRWMVEISLAKKRMKDWHENCKKLWSLYQGKGRKKNSYNALFSNTEILGPSVYNTLPTPDTRRRFAQADPVGKSVSEVINRSLTFNAETTGFDTEIRADVLDMLIVGRGISRVRYVPDLVQVGDTALTGEPAQETNLSHEAQQGEQNEELAWESAPIEHVKWDMYLCGPGRSFKEIPWWAFKHKLTREELCRRFGDEIGNQIELNGGVDDSEIARSTDEETAALFKTADVWEIWDMDSRTVIWVCESYRKGPVLVEPDPLELEKFFPVVDPLRAIEDSDSFDAVPLYEQYREQAEELDRISTRINKLVVAVKARAIYDPSLGPQVAELFRGDDNDLIPADLDIKKLYEAGGIEKAIWFAPIEQIVNVIQALYEQREQCKQVIYELTGIADIMRGSTDAQETKGAQDLKVAFGMTRLSRMQRAVQRYIRDMFALQAEVICQKFSLDTLKQMTQVNLPTDAEVMPQRMQMMQKAVMAKMAGQNVPPLPPKPTTWEDVHKALQSDLQRTFRVDIETDSTIAAAQQEDATDLAAVMTAVVEMIKEIGPLVAEGVMPPAAFKELLLMVCRKFRMGSAIEDAFEQMQPPPPKTDPKIQAQLQVEQIRQQGKQQEVAAQVQVEREKAQIQMQVEQQKAQLDAQVAQAQQQAQAQQAAQENQLEAQRDQQKLHNDMQLEQMRLHVDSQLQAMNQQLQLLIAQLNNKAKVEVAEIAAQTTLDAAQISAASQGAED